MANHSQRATTAGGGAKVERLAVKPTDGIFARVNRRISIPISRQIIPFPITPNMVSLFTLAVSLAGGVFLALGGYWNMLTGAALGWLSSVLDGCDGEVARLKLQESAFGCWLETMCDNLFYLFIFTGMTIGLVRSTGNRTYLLWGGLLLFGALASFLTTGLQRHQLANGRPEQYLASSGTRKPTVAVRTLSCTSDGIRSSSSGAAFYPMLFCFLLFSTS